MDNGDVLTMMAQPFCEARCRFEFRAAYNLPYGTSRFVRHDPFLSALTFRPRRFLQTALFEMTWYTCRFILLALKPGTGAPDAAKLAKIPEKTAAAHIACGPDKRHKAHSAHRTCRLWLNKFCMQTGLKRPPRLHMGRHGGFKRSTGHGIRRHQRSTHEKRLKHTIVLHSS